MESIKEIFEAVSGMRSESIEYTYLDDEHKKLDSSVTNVNDNIFMNKKIFYDDKDRVCKSEEEVFFGSGMKKKSVGINTQSFTYEDNDETETVKATTEMYNSEKDTRITAVEMTSCRNKKDNSCLVTEIVFDDKTGQPARKAITKSDDSSTVREEYVYDKLGNDIKISTTTVDNETDTTTITQLAPDRVTESTMIRKPCTIEGNEDEEEIKESVTSNGVKIQSREVNFRLNKDKMLNRIENISVSQNGKVIQVTDNATFCKGDNDIWVLEGIKKSKDDGTGKEYIQSYNEKSEDVTTVMMPNNIIVSSLHNRSNVQWVKAIDPRVSMPIENIKYFLVEGNSTIKAEYINGNLMSFLGHYITDDSIYNIMFQINPDKRNPIAAFNIEESDKDENTLRKSKFNLRIDTNEDKLFFDNIFNLLIKDFEAVYGIGCIKTEKQKNTVLIKDTDFEKLNTRQTILRR